MISQLFYNTSTTLAVAYTAGSTTATLSSAAFGTPSGPTILTLDGANQALAAQYLCTITGTAVSGMTLLQGASNNHAVGATVSFNLGPDIIKDVYTAMYPVGSIYMNASVSTNPATLLGFGTWVAFGSGQVPVGYKSGDTNFGTLGQTGGEVTHTLSTGEMPSHSHGVTDPSHTHSLQTGSGGVYIQNNVNYSGTGFNPLTADTRTQQVIVANNTTGISIQNAGSGSAHNNLQPYVTVYMWERTA